MSDIGAWQNEVTAMDLPATSNADVTQLRRHQRQRHATTTASDTYAIHAPVHAAFHHRLAVPIGIVRTVTPEPEPQTCTGVLAASGPRSGHVRFARAHAGGRSRQC